MKNRNKIIIVLIATAILMVMLLTFAIIQINTKEDIVEVSEDDVIIRTDHKKNDQGQREVERFWDKDKREISDKDVVENMNMALRYLEEGDFRETNNIGDSLFSKFEVKGEEYEKNKGFYEDLPLIEYVSEMFELDSYGAATLVKTFRHEYTLLAGALKLDGENLPYVVLSKNSLVPDLNVGFHVLSLEEVDMNEDSIPMKEVHKYNKNVEKATKIKVIIGNEYLSVYFSKNKGEDFVNLVMFYDETGETELRTQQEWNEIYDELYKNLNGETKKELEVELETEGGENNGD